MSRAVHEPNLHVNYRISTEMAAIDRIPTALLDGIDVVPRNHAAPGRILKFESRTGLARLDLDARLKLPA